MLALRADPRVRALVLVLDLTRPFALATCFVVRPGERGEIGDYLAALLLHHFVILGQSGPSTKTVNGAGP